MSPWQVYAVSDDRPRHHFIGFIVARGVDGEVDSPVSTWTHSPVKFFRNRRDAVRERDAMRRLDQIVIVAKASGAEDSARGRLWGSSPAVKAYWKQFGPCIATSSDLTGACGAGDGEPCRSLRSGRLISTVHSSRKLRVPPDRKEVWP